MIDRLYKLDISLGDKVKIKGDRVNRVGVVSKVVSKIEHIRGFPYEYLTYFVTFEDNSVDKVVRCSYYQLQKVNL